MRLLNNNFLDLSKTNVKKTKKYLLSKITIHSKSCYDYQSLFLFLITLSLQVPMSVILRYNIFVLNIHLIVAYLILHCCLYIIIG